MNDIYVVLAIQFSCFFHDQLKNNYQYIFVVVVVKGRILLCTRGYPEVHYADSAILNPESSTFLCLLNDGSKGVFFFLAFF